MNEEYHPLLPFVGAFVPLLIKEWEQVGGPDEYETKLAMDRFRKILEMEDGAEGGVELLYSIPGKTDKAMSALLQALAVMAFIPGGITVFGHHFEAGKWSTELSPAQKQIRELRGERI